ncbi:MAG: response regulator transcription factor [Planctomycetales bacterium]|nr:response regulator transcription factor [Planctomycetales bacterium]
MRKWVARVMIVDDHALIRRGLVELIDNEPDLEVCGEAENAADALALTASAKPDLLVVDISLGGMNGLELIKRLRARDENAKILVLSMHDDELYAERALRAGATGYVNKNEPPDRLVDAMQSVLRGGTSFAPAITSRLLQRSVGKVSSDRDSYTGQLSDRELEVFELIGQGVSTREIAEKLHLSVKTIETHREKIKAKLKLRSGVELGRAAVQWVLEQA